MGLLERFTTLYTPLDIEYAQVMSGVYGPVEFYGEECEIVAAVKDGRVTGYWRPMVAFGDDEPLRENVELLWVAYQDIFYQDFLIDGQLSSISRFLLDKGYAATPYYTQVIDLSKSTEDLRRDVRRSYHSLINKTGRVEFCSVETFQGIHELVKGKTRSQESWDIQKRMDTVCCHESGVCGVMFYAGPVWAYYASAAGDDIHACTWSALMELKNRGVHWCEMGEQTWDQSNPKMVNISRYKKGLGGETRVRLNLRKGQS